jgi:hypothetical protein
VLTGPRAKRKLLAAYKNNNGRHYSYYVVLLWEFTDTAQVQEAGQVAADVQEQGGEQRGGVKVGSDVVTSGCSASAS